MNRRELHIPFYLIIFSVLLTSCPSSFLPEELSIFKDIEPPEITIDSPVQGSYFESSVTISGSVKDISDSGEVRDSDPSETISSCYWEIQGDASAGGDIEIEADGAFSFSFPSSAYSGQIIVIITAKDKNGNLSSASIILAPDQNGPFISVTSPANSSEYATVITLSGTVTNSLEDPDTSEIFPVVDYEITGTNRVGTIDVDRNTGIFSKALDVSGVSGDKTIMVSASDLNGNETKIYVSITKPSDGGDISGFTVTPSHNMVTVEWEPVPGAVSYTLYELSYNDARTDVSSPFVWTGLENGNLYTFRLQAVVPGSDDAYSADVSEIPLSTRSLAPWIAGTAYKSITLEWEALPGVSQYTLERSLSSEGPWVVRQNLSSNTFTDTQVENDISYMYRVMPQGYYTIPSDAAAAAAYRFGEPVQISGGIFTDPDGYEAYVFDLAARGDYMYLAINQLGLQIMDITDPENPFPAGGDGLFHNDDTWNAMGLFLEGDYVYMADAAEGLQIFDVSDPSSPELRGSYDPGGYSYTVAVQGGYAYVANGSSGLQVIDISDPSLPAPVDTCVTDNARDVFIDGDYAYVADYGGGLQIVNISSPASTSVSGSIATPGNANAVSVSGSYAYIADAYDGVTVIDVSTPSAPSIVTTYYEGSEPNYTSYVKNLDIMGNYLFASNNSNGIQILDISNPSSPSLVYDCSYFSTDGYAYAVDAAGPYLFLADDWKGFKIFELALPLEPHYAGGDGQCSVPGYAYDVEVSGKYAYIAGNNGLTIADVTDPSDPFVVSNLAAASTFTEISVSGSHVYMSGGAGCFVIDVSDPLNPVVEGNYDSSTASCRDVAVAGKYLFTAYANDGMQILDVSDSTSPEPVGGNGLYSTGSISASHIAVSGSYAYVLDSSDEFLVIDISNPVRPVLAGSCATPAAGFPEDIVLSGQYAFVVCGDTGLQVLDVSDPANPSIVGTYDSAGEGLGVDVSGDYAVIADGDAGIVVLDISDPTAPVLFGPDGLCDTSGSAEDVFISGSYVYVSDFDAGLQVIKLTPDL